MASPKPSPAAQTTPQAPGSVEHHRPGPYRRFEVCCNAAVYSDDSEDTRHFQGFGLTVGHVVQQLETTYRNCWQAHVVEGHEDPGTFWRDWEDLTIWSGAKIQAVVRAGPEGLDIYRFDGLDGGSLR